MVTPSPSARAREGLEGARRDVEAAGGEALVHAGFALAVFSVVATLLLSGIRFAGRHPDPVI